MAVCGAERRESTLIAVAVDSQEPVPARGSNSSTADARTGLPRVKTATGGLTRVRSRPNLADASAVWPVTHLNRLLGPGARRASKPRSELLFDGPAVGREWTIAGENCSSSELASPVDDPRRCGARTTPNTPAAGLFVVLRAANRRHGVHSGSGSCRGVRGVANDDFRFFVR